MPNQLTVPEWMREQFTPERMVRWLDGRQESRGPTSHSMQALVHLWGSKRGGGLERVYRPGLRGVRNHKVNGQWVCLYVFVDLFPVTYGGYKAEIRVECRGHRRSTLHRSVEGEVYFLHDENAPQKLNKVLRKLQEELSMKMAL